MFFLNDCTVTRTLKINIGICTAIEVVSTGFKEILFVNSFIELFRAWLYWRFFYVNSNISFIIICFSNLLKFNADVWQRLFIQWYWTFGVFIATRPNLNYLFWCINIFNVIFIVHEGNFLWLNFWIIILKHFESQSNSCDHQVELYEWWYNSTE